MPSSPDIPALYKSALPREQLAPAAVVLVACVVTILAYSLGLPGDFLLDDNVRLPGIDPAAFTFEEVVKETLRNLHGMTGRPVSILSLVLTKATSAASSAEAFRYQNILLHVLTGLIQFWALACILGQFGNATSGSTAPVEPRWMLAACITTIWLLHPLFVSTVLYSIQRIAILGALFVWLGILCYTKGREALGRNNNKTAILLLFIGAPLSILLGIGSKENAALLPVYFLLVTLFTRHQLTGIQAQRLARLAVIVLIVLPILSGSLYVAYNADALLSGYAFRPFSLIERILTQGFTIWTYMGYLVFPALRNMTIFHDNMWVATPENIPAYFALTSLIALAMLGFFARTRAPMVGFGILFFLGSHLMESTIFPLELVFEHRNYVGASGLFIALYGLVSHVLTRHSLAWSTPARTAVLVCICAALIPILAMRAWTWSDSRKVALTSLRDHPSSLRAHVKSANVLLQNQEPESAASVLHRAAGIAPSDAGPLVHLYVLKCEGMLTAAKEAEIRNAVRDKFLTAYASDGLGKISQVVRTEKCPRIAVEEARNLIDIALENPSLRVQYRYHLLLSAARLLASRERFPEALEYTERARAIEPSRITLPDRHWALILDARFARQAGLPDRYRENLERLRVLSENQRMYYRFAFPKLEEHINSREQSLPIRAIDD